MTRSQTPTVASTNSRHLIPHTFTNCHWNQVNESNSAATSSPSRGILRFSSPKADIPGFSTGTMCSLNDLLQFPQVAIFLKKNHETTEICNFPIIPLTSIGRCLKKAARKTHELCENDLRTVQWWRRPVEEIRQTANGDNGGINQ